MTSRSPYRIWNTCVDFVSGEFVLTSWEWPNGGSTILLRAVWIAFCVSAISIFLKLVLGSGCDWRALLDAAIPWFGTALGIVYVSLYTRYASQWTYLANIYHRIKEAEVRMPDNVAKVAEWKAGFIEDIEDLHLASKPTFASVIDAWSKDEKVKESFISSTLGSDLRLEALVDRVAAVCDLERRRRDALVFRKSRKPK